jgi:uncharacterized protein (TIGR02600 family)
MIVIRSKRPLLRRKGGFVLILVLGILILVSLLVVGFLSHALTQAKSVTSYRAQTDSLLLSDVAVDLVKAQIDDATSQSASIWASQPGAIRTFQNTGADSAYGTTYKLYSSSTLTSTNPPTDIPNDLPASADATDWVSNPMWTDLNAPVQRTDGTYAYPIIDVYNDPQDVPGVLGSTTSPSFTIKANLLNAIGPTAASHSIPGTLYPIPMPVRWLYILKQGQIIAPDSGSAAPTVTFIKASPNPSASNPIVGRVAFWTDDDTCRVNINTASVSGTSAAPGTGTTDINTFWDTPRFTGSDDYLLGLNQGVNNEFQRYPGHPAMTTLALALPEFTDASGNVSASNMAAILSFAPRYGNGGSVGGTVASGTTPTPTITLNSNPSGTPYRLFNSVNELLFNSPNALNASGQRYSVGTYPSGTTAILSRQQIETAKFFLTAHSRAPELNLSGWPVSSQSGTSYRTAADNLIAFCATTPGVSPSPYYFVRAPWVNPQASTTVAGVGSNSTFTDVNLTQNTNLLAYLDNLTSLPVPGVPGYPPSNTSTFDTKYTQLGMRQILTEIFDYIRITNSRDPGVDPNITQTPQPPSSAVPYSAPTAYDPANNSSTVGYGQILPTEINSSTTLNWGTYGFGRFQGRPIEASIIFIGVGKGPPVSSPQTWTGATPVPPNQAGIGSGIYYSSLPSGNPNPNNPCSATPPALAADTPPPGQTAVMALFVLTFFDPALGYARNTSFIVPQTTGLTNLFVGPTTGNSVPVNQQLFYQDGSERLGGLSTLVANYSTFSCANPGSLGSLMDFRMMLGGRTMGNSDDAAYPFYSDIINMPTGGTFTFNPPQGGAAAPLAFTVSIDANGHVGKANSPLVHTYSFLFPTATVSVPNVSTIPLFGSLVGRPLASYPDGTTSNDRFDDGRSTKMDLTNYLANMLDFPNDTIISLVPTAAYGDYRMLCAPYTPSSAFTSLYNYVKGSGTPPPIIWGTGASNGNYPQQAYGFIYPSGQYFQGSTHSSLVNGGTLVSGVNYSSQSTYYSSAGPLSPAGYGATPLVPWTVQNPKSGASTAPPDFDNGFGQLPDGPFINKPDEGAVYPSSASSTPPRVYYDNTGTYVASTVSPSFFFSPQRQVPSPVMFGSLPTGAPVGATLSGTAITAPTGGPTPWQTLLFQPGTGGHAGLGIPKDEYLLDLFWMPQVQPYAISEPFSTAGKVNLNYQIFPFTYIDRSTAIQSVLASEKVAEVPTTDGTSYKYDKQTALGTANTTGMGQVRYPLNLSETNGTLRQFVQNFANWTVFKSAAEICNVYLVPSNITTWTTDALAQAGWYGTGFGLVGDNTRERPYADIYSRITTKSNDFTVYYRVQTLKNPITTPDTSTAWTEGTGVITGEYRGSTTIERYIDPNNTSIPNYGSMSAATLAATPSLDSPTYYKWRVVQNDRFAP